MRFTNKSKGFLGVNRTFLLLKVQFKPTDTNILCFSSSVAPPNDCVRFAAELDFATGFLKELLEHPEEVFGEYLIRHPKLDIRFAAGLNNELSSIGKLSADEISLINRQQNL